jgi:hypothetical protein
MSRVSLSYFPQIHQHFTTYVKNHNHQHSSLQKFFAGTTVYRERVLRERSFFTRMNTDIALKHSHAKTFQINHTSKHLSLYASLLQRTPIPNKIQQPRASVSFTSLFTTSQSSHYKELTKVSKTHSHKREHRSQTLSFRSASHETLLRIDRTEELVWRRTQPHTSVVDDGTVANVTATTSRLPAVRASAVATTQTPSAPPVNTQTTPPQITKIDPQLVDRLTEDVIRRVEKRALIERQRRGL